MTTPRRVDIRKILRDPRKRRLLMAYNIQAIQAREGRDLTLEEALDVYDRMEKKRHARDK